MTETLVKILQKNQVENWLIREASKETAELFFIKKNLDMRRAEKVCRATVTVYRSFEKDGVRRLGNATFEADPSHTEEELDEKVRRAYLAASFVPNAWYALAPEVRDACGEAADLSLSEAAGRMAEALYQADRGEKSFINSAEIYVEKTRNHIRNSNGVDVSYTVFNVNGEYVAQCLKPQDVEIHRSFSYDVPDGEALAREAAETLRMVCDRAEARRAPKAGTYDVLLADRQAAEIFTFYAQRANGAYIYQKYSDYQPGDFIQGKREEVTGDLLTLTYLPTEPYSPEGVPMLKLPCVEDGVFRTVQTGMRYAAYLDVPPTGLYRKIGCRPGRVSLEEMKKRAGLYVVNFSDFQMNPMSGAFGGEIRLAYLNDGEKITPVTGGSINGSIFDAQKDFVFSAETQNTTRFAGPRAVLLKNVSVAGE